MKASGVGSGEGQRFDEAIPVQQEHGEGESTHFADGGQGSGGRREDPSEHLQAVNNNRPTPLMIIDYSKSRSVNHLFIFP